MGPLITPRFGPLTWSPNFLPERCRTNGRTSSLNIIENKAIAALFAKKHITILVTDSGLGGMSIFADIADRFKRNPLFSQVSLIYFNAWPEQNRGYNRLKDMNERIRVFDRALEGMIHFRPDIIMIACNTLSVLYDHTAFRRNETVPVVDIVRFGIDMVFEFLSQTTGATAILLGTLTTIASDVHRSKLIEKGVSPDRLVSQPCDQLATQIEKGPYRNEVVQLVDTFLEQAIKKVHSAPTALVGALVCTHFGYRRDLFKEKLEKRFQGPVTVLDPNRRMAASLFEGKEGGRYDHTKVKMQVVSRIIWDQIKIDAISGLIEKRSPETSQALREYKHIPDLFTF